MKKYKQSELKNLVKIGAAARVKSVEDLPTEWETIGISHGVNGMSGALLRDNCGNLYAITSRSSVLFYAV